MSVTVKGVSANAEQLSTIKEALAEAHNLGAGTRTKICCVMTMTQESTCLPLNYGDSSSLGPYQQLDTWGPASVRESPSGSTRMFLTGGEEGQPGFDSYYSLADGPPSDVSLDVACQTVQRSAFPSAYAPWEAEATATVAWWESTEKPPPSMHYARFPKKWQTSIKRYDALRELEHTGKLTKIEGVWLAARRVQMRLHARSVYRNATKRHPLKNGKPSWSVEYRGWMYQQLIHRAQGKRILPT